jgi:ribose 5-phosphate isomerase B
MTIAIAADHAGYDLKQVIIQKLKTKEILCKDFGTHSSESMDYPDVAHPLASAVENGEFPLGILICGSANGVAMAANKHAGIRGAICWNVELAELARLHNNANVLCLPSRFISEELALEIVNTFLSSNFEGGRHQKRIEKISC